MFTQRNLPGEEAEGNDSGKGFRAEEKGEKAEVLLRLEE